MRILHTSDWHLGQLFYQYDRTQEHERILAWLLDTLTAEHADALLIAGDVFDHASPSAIANRQFYRFLTEARRRTPHLSIVAVSGNHDSPGRLEAPSPFFEALGITVVGHVPRHPDGSIDTSRLVVPLRNRDGEVAAWCLAIPFLRTGDVAGMTAEASTTTGLKARSDDESGSRGGDESDARGFPSGTYAAGVARLYHHALDAALASRQAGQAIVAMGHCSVEGGVTSRDSERPILAGGLDALASDVFSHHLAYVALGHLHRAQQVGDDPRLRYSGSPMPLSFTEIDYPHQVVCVDLDGDALADTRAIRVPRFAPLLRVPAEPAPPDEVVAALQNLEVPDAEEGLRPYLDVRVRIERPEPGLRSRIEEALATKPVRLARIEPTYPPAAPGVDAAPARSLEDLATLQPDSVFLQAYRDRFGTDAPTEFIAAFGELLRMPAAGERS